MGTNILHESDRMHEIVGGIASSDLQRQVTEQMDTHHNPITDPEERQLILTLTGRINELVCSMQAKYFSDPEIQALTIVSYYIRFVRPYLQQARDPRDPTKLFEALSLGDDFTKYVDNQLRSQK